MAAVPQVGLHSAKLSAGIVADLLEVGKSRGCGGGAVVTGKDDDGVVLKAMVLEGLENLPAGIVGLHHEISVVVDATFAFPFFVGNDGRVRGIPRNVKEEGIGFALA